MVSSISCFSESRIYCNMKGWSEVGAYIYLCHQYYLSIFHQRCIVAKNLRIYSHQAKVNFTWCWNLTQWEPGKEDDASYNFKLYNMLIYETQQSHSVNRLISLNEWFNKFALISSSYAIVFWFSLHACIFLTSSFFLIRVRKIKIQVPVMCRMSLTFSFLWTIYI